METVSKGVRFFIDLAKVQAITNRRFDNGLGGLGFNEFIILYHLDRAEAGSMRRIDLAEAIGLTASGVTRILLPMEKVGYVKRQANKDDARSSLVLIAPGGKRRLEESLERAEFLADDLFSFYDTKEIHALSDAFAKFSKIVK